MKKIWRMWIIFDFKKIPLEIDNRNNYKLLLDLGLIKFNRNTESCLALFSANALYQNGYKITADPKSLPPVFFDAYKVKSFKNFQFRSW